MDVENVELFARRLRQRSAFQLGRFFVEDRQNIAPGKARVAVGVPDREQKAFSAVLFPRVG